MINIGFLDFFKREKEYPYVDGKKEELQALAAWRVDCDEYVRYLPYGYRSMVDSPEIKGGIEKIAEIISSMSIQLMKNTDNGDVRIKNGLSRFVDIEPSLKMNRQLLISWIVQEMMLHGNALIIPHTKNGLFVEFETIPYEEYSIVDDERNLKNNRTYYIRLNKDNKIYKPDEVLHFRYNPNLKKPWIGESQEIILKDLINGLGQARSTVHDFLEHQMLPTVVVRVDALPADLKSEEGRDEIEKRFIRRAKNGQPWIIPSMMDVEQMKPLTLNDVGINERVEIDKQTVASILGLPAFLLGVGQFDKDEYNNFIRTKIAVICKAIEQELTRKLLIDDNSYFIFNRKSMLSYDLDTLGGLYMDLFEHGIVTGNEVRDVMGMSPLEGLDELLILENYIPVDKSGEQEKLKDSDNSSDKNSNKNADENSEDSDDKKGGDSGGKESPIQDKQD